MMKIIISVQTMPLLVFKRFLYGHDKATLMLLCVLKRLARFQNTREKLACKIREAKSCIYHALEWQWSRVKKWPFAVLSIISLSRPVSHLITQVTSAQTRAHYGGAFGRPSSWNHKKTSYFNCVFNQFAIMSNHCMFSFISPHVYMYASRNDL